MIQTYLDMAEVLARRSPCKRLHVGVIITDKNLENTVALGYNGPEHGGPNSCRGTGAGQCGCIHGEMNAIVKAPYDKGDLVMFATHSPCHTCAMLICQSKVRKILYKHEYRIKDGIYLLRERGLYVERWTDFVRVEGLGTDPA